LHGKPENEFLQSSDTHDEELDEQLNEEYSDEPDERTPLTT